jgi:hypothetical protein
MEVGVAANEIGLLLERQTALGLDGLQGVEACEAPIGEWFIGERPEPLGGLQLRGVGGQGNEVDALWHLHRLPGMPAGPIQDQGNLLLWSRSHIPGKGGEHLTEESSGDRREEPPLGLAGGGTHEATDIEPLVALLDRSKRALADGCPDATNERKEPNAMLIGGPELDRCSGMRRPDRRYPGSELC